MVIVYILAALAAILFSGFIIGIVKEMVVDEVREYLTHVMTPTVSVRQPDGLLLTLPDYGTYLSYKGALSHMPVRDYLSAIYAYELGSRRPSPSVLSKVEGLAASCITEGDDVCFPRFSPTLTEGSMMVLRYSDGTEREYGHSGGQCWRIPLSELLDHRVSALVFRM